ncbi:hypothetical protein AB0L65_57155 [Nonomuraea sp. NPDC052116]|uniref:hypothetical protein n=1 Tax=Nonomuraea sp. NPDC052116 TaxID=3155665 RepID=UPI0034316F67
MSDKRSTGLSRRAVLATAATLPLIAATPAAAAAKGWTWKLLTEGTDVWQRNSWKGREQFDFRLGGGGCIPQMRHCPTGYRPLLSPTYEGEETDRVMQAVLWGLNVEAATNVLDRRWNVNQAGTRPGAYQRTVRVERTTPTATDVWTIADRQWYAELVADFAGSDAVPQLTRYTRLSNGTLEIRRVIRLPKVVNAGTTVANVEFYLENWLPFLRSADAFTALALRLDANGDPSEWYRAGQNIPYYPWTPTSTTSGYAMVYQEGTHRTTPNVAVVFSKNPGTKHATSAVFENVRNSMDWDTGIGILPGAHIIGGEADSILDYTIRIVPNGGTSAGLVTDLNAQVAAIRPPALYGLSYALSGELGSIAGRLRGYLTSADGTRTNHLAPLLV